MGVCLPAQQVAVHVDRRCCTWMYETRNETAQICPLIGRCTVRKPTGHAALAHVPGSLTSATADRRR